MLANSRSSSSRTKSGFKQWTVHANQRASLLVVYYFCSVCIAFISSSALCCVCMSSLKRNGKFDLNNARDCLTKQINEKREKCRSARSEATEESKRGKEEEGKQVARMGFACTPEGTRMHSSSQFTSTPGTDLEASGKDTSQADWSDPITDTRRLNDLQIDQLERQTYCGSIGGRSTDNGQTQWTQR